jgi:F-box/leucine-rich repeat protein 10/11
LVPFTERKKGLSVVLQGKTAFISSVLQIFFMVPPTDHNLKLFEQWTKGGSQNQVFFGDICTGCSMVTLTVGEVNLYISLPLMATPL